MEGLLTIFGVRGVVLPPPITDDDEDVAGAGICVPR